MLQPRRMVALRDKYSKIKAQLKSENELAKKEAKQTGGGAAKTIRTPLVEKHEVFQQLAEIIALSIHGHEALKGDEDYVPLTSAQTTAADTVGAQKLDEMIESDERNELLFQSERNEFYFGNEEVFDFEQFCETVSVEEINETIDACNSSTPHTVNNVVTSTPLGSQSAVASNVSASSTQSSSKFKFQRKRKRYAGDDDAVPLNTDAVPDSVPGNTVAVPDVKQEDKKPCVKVLNPLSFRQPLHKALRVEKRHAVDEGKVEWREKLGESENELLKAKLATEQHKLLADQQHLRFAREEHRVKMQILKTQLAIAKKRKRMMSADEDVSADEDDYSSGGYDIDIDHNDYPNSCNSSPDASIL